MTEPKRITRATPSAAVDWLPPIPERWTVGRFKHIFHEVNRRSTAGSEQLLSVSQYSGVTPRRMNGDRVDTRASSLVGYKIVRPGDLVSNIMLAWNGSLGVSSHSGVVSPAYCVYGPRPGVVSRYYHYLLRTPLYKGRVKVSSRGVVDSRLRLYTGDFFRIEALVPPTEEQAAIARYLDHATAWLNRAVAAKRQVIKLLKEQKQAVIRRAVTRGLDPSATMKDTGIPWLGEVPAHWDVSRVRSFFKNLNNRRVPLSSTERGKMKKRTYPYYGASGIIDQVEDYIFDDELILIAEDGANLVLRNLPLAIIAEGKFWVNNHAHILKPRFGSAEFMAMNLELLDYRPWITGAAQPKLTKDRLMGIQIAAPPSEEQAVIVKHVTPENAPADRTIRQVEHEIALLEEYRTALTAEVVTGQRDVRAAAAALPPLEEAPDDAMTDMLLEEAEDLAEAAE